MVVTSAPSFITASVRHELIGTGAARPVVTPLLGAGQVELKSQRIVPRGY
jgi:hypothetical protein